jgi:acyl-coenzyme A thioesterase PaaI-like protein
MDNKAFQDLMPFNHCWGCGPGNPEGLRLKSFWEGGRAVATFEPRPEHAAGPRHVLNGGILATVVDCHGICTAIADAYRREQREIGTGENIWYVTARLEVTYLHPTPIDRRLRLEATVARREGRKTWVQVSVEAAGEQTARGELLAVRVEPRLLDGAG